MAELKVELHKRLLENLNLAALEHASEASLKSEISAIVAEALEPVLKRAMDAGITVITHEAAAQQNTNYDLEAFVNEDFGANLMEQMAKCMGGEGEYAVFVGALTSQTHNQWVDGAIAYQKANYPNMTLVGDKNETFDDQQQAYAKAQGMWRHAGAPAANYTDVVELDLGSVEPSLAGPKRPQDRVPLRLLKQAYRKSLVPMSEERTRKNPTATGTAVVTGCLLYTSPSPRDS